MYDAILKVEAREVTSKGANKLLRKNGYLPGNISGKGIDSIAIAVKKDDLRKTLKQSGRNAVLKLESGENKSYTVLTREMHVAPIINEISHVDFQIVSLSEKVKQDVAIKLVGTEFVESKRLLINSFIDFIPVIGLPQDIPHEIIVDITNLVPGKTMLLKDIKLPEGITTEVDPEEKIVSVKGSKKQEIAAGEE